MCPGSTLTYFSQTTTHFFLLLWRDSEWNMELIFEMHSSYNTSCTHFCMSTRYSIDNMQCIGNMKYIMVVNRTLLELSFWNFSPFMCYLKYNILSPFSLSCAVACRQFISYKHTSIRYFLLYNISRIWEITNNNTKRSYVSNIIK